MNTLNQLVGAAFKILVIAIVIAMTISLGKCCYGKPAATSIPNASSQVEAKKLELAQLQVTAMQKRKADLEAQANRQPGQTAQQHPQATAPAFLPPVNPILPANNRVQKRIEHAQRLADAAEEARAIAHASSMKFGADSYTAKIAWKRAEEAQVIANTAIAETNQ